jgi:hypothetical protein
MTKTNNNNKPQETPMKTKTARQRRALLKKLGRFAAVTAPTVTLLLAAQARPGRAQPISGCRASSKAFKIVVAKIDVAGVLSGVATLPVGAWRYESEVELDQRNNIGPFAKDFEAAFDVGDGATISSIDAIGVCLAAIKALSAKVESLEGELRAAHRKKAA